MIFTLQKIPQSNFTQFHGVEMFWKDTGLSQFRAIFQKLCGNCAFLQNFHTMKLGEITVFFTVLEFTDEHFPMASVDVYVQPFTACKMKSKCLIIYIIRVAYLQEGKKSMQVA